MLCHNFFFFFCVCFLSSLSHFFCVSTVRLLPSLSLDLPTFVWQLCGAKIIMSSIEASKVSHLFIFFLYSHVYNSHKNLWGCLWEYGWIYKYIHFFFIQPEAIFCRFFFFFALFYIHIWEDFFFKSILHFSSPCNWICRQKPLCEFIWRTWLRWFKREQASERRIDKAFCRPKELELESERKNCKPLIYDSCDFLHSFLSHRIYGLFFSLFFFFLSSLCEMFQHGIINCHIIISLHLSFKKKIHAEKKIK
jgi:hypothetical protein